MVVLANCRERLKSRCIQDLLVKGEVVIIKDFDDMLLNKYSWVKIYQFRYCVGVMVFVYCYVLLLYVVNINKNKNSFPN